MNTTMQEFIEYLETQQQTISLQWHLKKAKDLLESERLQIQDAFVNGTFEGYKSVKGLTAILPIDYYNKKYKNDTETKS